MMWGWNWGWGMGIGMVAFWVFVAVLVWALARMPHTHAPHEDKPTAEDILAERFARGEISAEEFEERKRVLAQR